MWVLNVLNIEQAYAEIKSAGLETLEDNVGVFLPFREHGIKYSTVRGPYEEKIESTKFPAHESHTIGSVSLVS